MMLYPIGGISLVRLMSSVSLIHVSVITHKSMLFSVIYCWKELVLLHMDLAFTNDNASCVALS